MATVYEKDAFGQPHYPLDDDGEPEYPRDRNFPAKQRYFLDRFHLRSFDPPPDRKYGPMPLFGINAQGNERYAKDEQGDEYYPDRGRYPYAYHAQSDRYLYATARDGRLVFRKDARQFEIYVRDHRTGNDVVRRPDGTWIERYARDDRDNEVYPIAVATGGRGVVDVVIGDRYAVDSLQKAVYPRDEFANEYVRTDFQTEKGIYPSGYPKTWDGYVTVPPDPVSGEPLTFGQALPHLLKHQLPHRLQRSANVGGVDYLAAHPDPNTVPLVKGFAYTSWVATDKAEEGSGAGWIGCVLVALGAAVLAWACVRHVRSSSDRTRE